MARTRLLRHSECGRMSSSERCLVIGIVPRSKRCSRAEECGCWPIAVVVGSVVGSVMDKISDGTKKDLPRPKHHCAFPSSPSIIHLSTTRQPDCISCEHAGSEGIVWSPYPRIGGRIPRGRKSRGKHAAFGSSAQLVICALLGSIQTFGWRKSDTQQPFGGCTHSSSSAPSSACWLPARTAPRAALPQ